jgi:site-specific recombinase
MPPCTTAFVDEVTHLVRSQVAAVFGNVFMVVPAVLLVNTLIQLLLGRPDDQTPRAPSMCWAR